MSTTQLKIAITAGLFLCIFVFGFWLSRSGKPYNVVIFTIHKLVALGAVIYLATTVYKIHQLIPFNPAQIFFIALTAVCLLALFVTGALLSLDKVMPRTQAASYCPLPDCTFDNSKFLSITGQKQRNTIRMAGSAKKSSFPCWKTFHACECICASVTSR